MLKEECGKIGGVTMKKSIIKMRKPLHLEKQCGLFRKLLSLKKGERLRFTIYNNGVKEVKEVEGK